MFTKDELIDWTLNNTKSILESREDNSDFLAETVRVWLKSRHDDIEIIKVLADNLMFDGQIIDYFGLDPAETGVICRLSDETTAYLDEMDYDTVMKVIEIIRTRYAEKKEKSETERKVIAIGDVVKLKSNDNLYVKGVVIGFADKDYVTLQMIGWGDKAHVHRSIIIADNECYQ